MEDSQGAKIYRFTPYFLWVSHLQAAGAVLVGCCLIAQESRDGQYSQGPIKEGFFGILFLFLAAYLVAQARHSAVFLARDFVSVRTVWGTRTLAKDDILGVKIDWRSGIVYTTFEPKYSKEKPIAVERFFSFDEEWTDWISSLPNLDRDHKLQVV